jgi:hypothetical protein
MTVGELVAKLMKCDQNKEVFVPALIYSGVVANVYEDDDHVLIEG